jgi:opacity protein-like surface antigen
MQIFAEAAGRRRLLFAAAALMAGVAGSSGAFAQCTVPVQTGVVIPNVGDFAVPTAATAATISSAIGNVTTAFLTQQGSAFVSAPPNPLPNQPGGGVWARGVGGELNFNTTSTSSLTTTPTAGGAPVNTAVTRCNSSQGVSFGGVQAGADIARLNWNGWNVHLGTTAGYLESKSNDNFGFSNRIEVPFFGTYVVATYGRFFADLMVREEFYNINLSNAGFTFFNQPVGAHGYSISGSAGYNFDLGNGWFIEPSAGFIYAKTSVDSFTSAGSAALGIPASINTNDVESQIGRATLRVGKVISTPTVNWQPFATVSVFREFAGDVVTNATSLPNSAVLGGVTPVNIVQQTTSSRVGTYGQYSLGIAGQIVNTGWLAFARVDYRNGDHVDGWIGNAGIRYQFTPETIAAAMPAKIPVKARPVLTPVNWTGFYVGGVVGAAAGRTDIGFVGDGGTKPWVLGGLGGIEAGYNYQFSNNWVLGVEGDVVATNLRGARTAGTADGLPPPGFSPALYTAQDRTNWMATVTGRLGYSYERTLWYGKGGVAFEDSSTSVNCIFGPTATLLAFNCRNQALAVSPGFSTANYTRVGWTVGFGSEFDLGKNWSAKAEYDYLSFGRHTALATDGTTFLTDKSDVSQVKVGLNYRFSGPTAVVAKY